MYVRHIRKEGKPVTKIVDLVPLKTGDAQGVTDAITQGACEKYDLGKPELKQKLVGCNSDGASVMMGSKTGVAKRTSEMVEHSIVTIHCVAHNLELAVADAVKTVPYLQKFQDTIYQVFKFYYYSLKKRRELQDVIDIIQENTAHFGGVSTTRWLASRHRALVPLEKNFPVSVSHLEHVATGRGGDAAKAKGILKFLKTENFFKMLCFMLDITKTLRDLSVQFQSNQLLITDVGRKIEATLSNLEVLKPRLPPQTVNSKLPQAHYQVMFEANFNPLAGILKCGKDLKQEVKLSTIGPREMKHSQVSLQLQLSIWRKDLKSLVKSHLSILRS